MAFALNDEQKMMIDTLRRFIAEEIKPLEQRIFGNVYEPLLHCQGAQVERWLKPTVEGRRTCVITEPVAGSDAAGIKTHAKEYRIFDGTSEIHRGVIAKSAMKQGAALLDVNR